MTEIPLSCGGDGARTGAARSWLPADMGWAHRFAAFGGNAVQHLGGQSGPGQERPRATIALRLLDLNEQTLVGVAGKSGSIASFRGDGGHVCLTPISRRIRR